MSLVEACQNADIDQVKYLIEQKCNVNQLDDQGRIALHYCCNHQTIDCACLLVENSTINLQDNEGCSPLHLACLHGNITMVKYLCQQGADVELVDNESHSLIHWITVCGHLELFDILLQYQAPIHTSDIHNAFPIHYASQLCGNDESAIDPVRGLAILKKLIEYKAEIDCVDGQKRTPFTWAASAGAIDALRILYKAGANPLHVDKDSLTALHCATTHGHRSCIRMLIELYGCPIESEDINGCTALFYAVTHQHSNACQILLDLKANPNHQDNRGRTSSHCAALKGNIDCLKRLIKFDANIWIKTKRGDYPIHEAINAISLCKLRNETIDLTQLQTRCLDVVRYIFQLYPKKINIQNDEHKTPLHLAASLGDITMCQVLIECGAKINSFIQTSAGNFLTPYDLARVRRHDTCAEYLAYNHGGQRGNLLAHILIRRIQKCFRQYKIRKTSIVNQRRKLFAKTNTNKNISTSNDLSHPNDTSIPSIKSFDYLLNQAKLCLDNKILEDRLMRLKTNSSKLQTYLTSSPIEEEDNAQQRRSLFAKSKTTMTSIDHGDNLKLNSSDKIVIYTSNSIATSVKLYERHKLIAEELFKLKQARIHNHYIVINRPLYKILIENAFNPQNREANEIERYLETLLKAYETELDAIRKRTKSASPKRMLPSSQRITRNTNTNNIRRKK